MSGSVPHWAWALLAVHNCTADAAIRVIQMAYRLLLDMILTSGKLAGSDPFVGAESVAMCEFNARAPWLSSLSRPVQAFQVVSLRLLCSDIKIQSGWSSVRHRAM